MEAQVTNLLRKIPSPQLSLALLGYVSATTDYNGSVTVTVATRLVCFQIVLKLALVLELAAMAQAGT